MVIDLDYINKVTMKLSMIKYLDSALQWLSNHFGVTTTTSSAYYLFKVRNEIKTHYLTEDQAQSFRHTLSQLMFVSATEIWYIQTKVKFLTTHVKKQDENNLGKLNHVLNYLKLKRKLKLYLSVGDISVVKRWIYTLYMVQ